MGIFGQNFDFVSPWKLILKLFFILLPHPTLESFLGTLCSELKIIIDKLQTVQTVQTRKILFIENG